MTHLPHCAVGSSLLLSAQTKLGFGIAVRIDKSNAALTFADELGQEDDEEGCDEIVDALDVAGRRVADRPDVQDALEHLQQQHTRCGKGVATCAKKLSLPRTNSERNEEVGEVTQTLVETKGWVWWWRCTGGSVWLSWQHAHSRFAIHGNRLTTTHFHVRRFMSTARVYNACGQAQGNNQ